MKKLLIVGTGQHARMLVELIEEQGLYQIVGFVSKEKQNKKIYKYPIVCNDISLKLYLKKNPEVKYYLCGVGDNFGGMKGRKKIIEKFDKQLIPATIISPKAYISKNAKIQKGSVIEAFAKIMNGVNIGKHSMVESFTAVNHDQKVGSNVFIGNNCSLAGKSIGSDTIIGDGSVIGYKISIGSNCIINQGTKVYKNIKNNSIAYGAPLEIIKNNPLFTEILKNKKNA